MLRTLCGGHAVLRCGWDMMADVMNDIVDIVSRPRLDDYHIHDSYIIYNIYT